MSHNTLYVSDQPTRSKRALWAFEEAGIDFSTVSFNIFDGEHRQNDAHMSNNPLGYTPSATIDGAPMVESSALAFWAATERPKSACCPK